jgi:hypothetical protein
VSEYTVGGSSHTVFPEMPPTAIPSGNAQLPKSTSPYTKRDTPRTVAPFFPVWLHLSIQQVVINSP